MTDLGPPGSATKPACKKEVGHRLSLRGVADGPRPSRAASTRGMAPARRRGHVDSCIVSMKGRAPDDPLDGWTCVGRSTRSSRSPKLAPFPTAYVRKITLFAMKGACRQEGTELFVPQCPHVNLWRGSRSLAVPPGRHQHLRAGCRATAVHAIAWTLVRGTRGGGQNLKNHEEITTTGRVLLTLRAKTPVSHNRLAIST